MRETTVDLRYCTRCTNGTITVYSKIKQCKGCGYSPLDLSAWSCPRCRRNEDLHSEVPTSTYTCNNCDGTGRMMCLTHIDTGYWGFKTKTWELYAATKHNMDRFMPKPDPTYSYHAGDNNQISLTVAQILTRVKQNPTLRHRIYHNDQWNDAKDLKPFSQYIPQQIPQKKTRPQAPSKKNTRTKQQNKSKPRSKVNTKPKTSPKPKGPPRIVPRNDDQLRPLQSAFIDIKYYFLNLSWPGQTKRIGSKIDALIEDWDKGIDTTKKSQPKMDSTINAIYSLPDQYLALIIDHLETIELKKHLVSKQPASNYQAPAEEPLTYRRDYQPLQTLYKTFEDTREQFRSMLWPDKTYNLGMQIDLLLEEWDNGIDITKANQPQMDMIINRIYALKDHTLLQIVDKLEIIEQHKSLICQQPKTVQTKKRQTSTGKHTNRNHNDNRFSARTLHQEIIDSNNGWLLDIHTKNLQTDDGDWNQSRIGTVAKVLRDYDSRISFQIFLQWCKKYGNDTFITIPVLGKRTFVKRIFQLIYKTGQFADDELKGQVYLKGSNDTEPLEIK